MSGFGILGGGLEGCSGWSGSCGGLLGSGIFFVVDLRAFLVDLSYNFVALGDQTEARTVACKESAEADSQVSTTSGDEVADVGSVWFRLFPCLLEI